jgi:hypothetical protein
LSNNAAILLLFANRPVLVPPESSATIEPFQPPNAVIDRDSAAAGALVIGQRFGGHEMRCWLRSSEGVRACGPVRPPACAAGPLKRGASSKGRCWVTKCAASLPLSGYRQRLPDRNAITVTEQDIARRVPAF